PLLADYVKEEVLIRYDPADMAEIRVFYQDRFLCRAICPELAGATISLKEIEKARAARRKQLKAGLTSRQAGGEQFLAAHQEETLPPKRSASEPKELAARPRLNKRLARAAQLYSRIGFAHQMEPLSEEETRFFLEKRWSHRVRPHSDDFTDQEAVT